MKEYKELRRFMEMDVWSPEQAVNLFLGYYSVGEDIYSLRTGYEIGDECSLNSRLLDDTSLNAFGVTFLDYREEKSRVYQEVGKKIYQYLELWNHCIHDEGASRQSKYSKEYCIQWAVSKGIKIPWLQCAIENGFLPPDVGLAVSKVLHKKKRQQAMPLQEELILEAIRFFGFDPESLPPRKPGKKTVRADAKIKLEAERKDLFGKESFKHAWNRLREEGRIKEICSNPKLHPPKKGCREGLLGG
jgi:hypothetical protein